jgi:transcriptional regulator with XRE-family HTH domain
MASELNQRSASVSGTVLAVKHRRRQRLPEGLEQYRVGAKVRRLRLRKKISLDELGRHTSLSPALLSKLERGQVMPTLPTLLRIALVFGIGLEDFFVSEGPGAAVVRADQRLRFPERQDDSDSAYDFESLDYDATGREMNAYLAVFRDRDAGVRVHAHDAAEILYVISGELTVQIDGVDHILKAGDSVYLHPLVPHGYAKRGEGPCQAVVVTTAAPAAASYAPAPKPDRR